MEGLLFYILKEKQVQCFESEAIAKNPVLAEKIRF
jgi:hypothetical protein